MHFILFAISKSVIDHFGESCHWWESCWWQVSHQYNKPVLVYIWVSFIQWFNIWNRTHVIILLDLFMWLWLIIYILTYILLFIINYFYFSFILQRGYYIDCFCTGKLYVQGSYMVYKFNFRTVKKTLQNICYKKGNGTYGVQKHQCVTQNFPEQIIPHWGLNEELELIRQRVSEGLAEVCSII